MSQTQVMLGSDFWSRPHETWRRLRQRSPVVPVRFPSGQSAHAVLTWNGVREGLANATLSSAGVDEGRGGDRIMRSRGARIMKSMMITSDGHAHQRLRQVVTPYFVGRGVDTHVDAAMPTVTAFAAGRSDHREAVSEVATPASARILASLLGVPDGRFLAFSALLDDPVRKRSTEPSKVLVLARDLLAGGYADGDGHTLTTLLRDGVRRGEISMDEAIAMVALTIYAGHTTNVLLLSYTILNMVMHPDVALDSARDADRFVIETMRLESPIFPGLWRRTTEDLMVDGTTIPAGETVLLSLMSANRDPAKFDDPDEFHPATRTGEHLSFGHGMHRCIGARIGQSLAAGVVGHLRETGFARDWELAAGGAVSWSRTERRGLHHLRLLRSSAASSVHDR